MAIDEPLEVHRKPAALRVLIYVGQLVALCAAYYVAARYSQAVVAAHPNAAAIWPPAGLALAAILLGGYRMLPAVLAGAFLANALSSGPTYAAAETAVGNAVEALAAGFLINRLADGRNSYGSPAGVMKSLLVAVFATAVGATIGASV